MQNRATWFLFLSLSLLVMAGLLTGCAADAPASDSKPELKAEPTEIVTVDSGISVSGTMVKAAGKSVDLGEEDEDIRSIESCYWLEKNKIAAQCSVAGRHNQEYYFVVYDLVRDLYLYEQYGKQFIWQNDDLDTLIYVLDYSGEGEPSKVCSKNNIVLYESNADEQIQNVAFVPKGIKIELTDLRGDNPHQVIVESAV